MSKIKIFALGGLNEDGKNMYVCSVDNDIFIFDAGLKYPKDRILGIDYIVPNYDFIRDNYKNIKGIFISHGHETNMGGLADICLMFPKLPIYASRFSCNVIKRLFEDNEVSEYNLIEIKAHVKLDFGKNSIFPISVSHSIPDSLCFVLNTSDGAIVYTGDFIFDPGMSDCYKMDIGKLAYVGKQGVLCLMSESLYASRKGFTSPNHRTNHFIRETLVNYPERIIMSILPQHVYRIQEIFDEVSNTNRRIVIMGKRLQDYINHAIDNGYLNINKNIIGDLSNLNDKGVVVMIADNKGRPFVSLERIINNKDKFIIPKETDTIFITEPMYIGVEKRMVQIMDDIAMNNLNVISLSNKKHYLEHASREDLMMMINLMNPKYYFPVKGEYKDQFMNAEIATKCGISNDNIILRLNGEVVEFNDGIMSESRDTVDSNELLIHGKSQNDIGELVLKDRELLAENGIVLIVASIDKMTKEILAGPEVITRGFIYVKDNMDIVKESSVISEQVIRNNICPGERTDFNQIKVEIREKLGNYLYHETDCHPIIITIIQEI